MVMSEQDWAFWLAASAERRAKQELENANAELTEAEAYVKKAEAALEAARAAKREAS